MREGDEAADIKGEDGAGASCVDGPAGLAFEACEGGGFA
jgi:hypothetical protein